MSDNTEHVPGDLDQRPDDLAEKLRDPGRRADRTIEDQGEEGAIESESKPDESTEDNG